MHSVPFTFVLLVAAVQLNLAEMTLRALRAARLVVVVRQARVQRVVQGVQAQRVVQPRTQPGVQGHRQWGRARRVSTGFSTLVRIHQRLTVPQRLPGELTRDFDDYDLLILSIAQFNSADEPRRGNVLNGNRFSYGILCKFVKRGIPHSISFFFCEKDLTLLLNKRKKDRKREFT